MIRLLLPVVISLFVAATAALGSAQAQSGGLIDEFRFGLVAANPDFIDADHPESDQFAINAELLFAPFDFDRRASAEDDFLHSLLTPRFHIGSTVNFDKHGTSTFYGGLTWHRALNDIFFLEASFGLSANDGEKNGKVGANRQLERARLGSNVTFRESLALGINVTERMNVVLAIAHNSHARLFDEKNRGLTNISLKTGFRF